MPSRRQFLLQAGSIVSLAPLAPVMLCRAARAAGAQRDARALVVIQLDGGNDGLNTVVPFADDDYPRLRPKLHIAGDDLLKLDDRVALHPQMRAAKELFDDGRLAVVQGVGYPNPDRSHFSSMRIWHTANPAAAAGDAYGWLGRAADQELARLGEAPDASLVFVGDDEAPLALWARRAEAICLSNPDDLTLQSAPGKLALPQASAVDVRQFVYRQTLSAYESAEALARSGAPPKKSQPSYPDSTIGARLSVISQLIKADCGARVYYATQPGYDTHAAQEYTHANLLRELSSALKAFLDDLRGAGLEDRVVVLAFSEFGRRAAENDSLGTDHGAAGPVFVAGAPVNGGLIGIAPRLDDLADGDVQMTIDFRQVYATVLERWLGLPPVEILGSAFQSLPLFST